MKTLQQEVTEWADNTFSNSSLKSRLVHLMRELNEAYEATFGLSTMAGDVDKIRMEIADAGLITLHAASGIGIEIDESNLNEYFVNAMYAKLHENRKRVWGDPDAEGVVEHLRVRRAK